MTIRAKQQRKQRATVDRMARYPSSVWYRVRRLGLPGAMLIRDAARWAQETLSKSDTMIVTATTSGGRAAARPHVLGVIDE